MGHGRIGRNGCTALAELLKGESTLEELSLSNNDIDSESAVKLATALAKNNKLRKLNLRGNTAITAPGWSALLKLVCNSSSLAEVMASNHTLNDLGIPTVALIQSQQFSTDYISLLWSYRKAVDQALGEDGANLLRSSLKLNEENKAFCSYKEERNKMMVVRRKILWCHVRGNFNLGDCSITAGAMPRILAWIGNDSHEASAKLIQYHDPPLPKTKLDSFRLDSIYRILRSMPCLMQNASETIGSKASFHCPIYNDDDPSNWSKSKKKRMKRKRREAEREASKKKLRLMEYPKEDRVYIDILASLRHIT